MFKLISIPHAWGLEIKYIKAHNLFGGCFILFFRNMFEEKKIIFPGDFKFRHFNFICMVWFIHRSYYVGRVKLWASITSVYLYHKWNHFNSKTNRTIVSTTVNNLPRLAWTFTATVYCSGYPASKTAELTVNTKRE